MYDISLHPFASIQNIDRLLGSSNFYWDEVKRILRDTGMNHCIEHVSSGSKAFENILSMPEIDCFTQDCPFILAPIKALRDMYNSFPSPDGHVKHRTKIYTSSVQEWPTDKPYKWFDCKKYFVLLSKEESCIRMFFYRLTP